MSNYVIIDAGHGGSDPGAVYNGKREKDYTLQISNIVKTELERSGVNVVLTRTSDVDVSLQARTNLENSGSYALFISVHLNAGGGTGTEVYRSIVGGVSSDCANKILNKIVRLGFANRGVKTKVGDDGRDYFHVIRETKCPSVLVETCFIDNVNDMAKLNVTEMAKAIAQGICETLGVAYVPVAATPPVVTPPTNPDNLYRVQVGAFADRKNAEKYVEELKQKGINAIIS